MLIQVFDLFDSYHNHFSISVQYLLHPIVSFFYTLAISAKLVVLNSFETCIFTAFRHVLFIRRGYDVG